MSERRVRHVPVTEDRLRHVVLNLRERDRAEIFALRWDDDPEGFLREALPQCGAMTWIWERDGVPVSIQGALPVRPGVWTAFAFGTGGWPGVVLDMTRHSRRFIMPALLRAGFRRCECRALASHVDSRKWILSLGAYEEATLERYGRRGETFVSYVWRPEDVQQQREQRAEPGRHFAPRTANGGGAESVRRGDCGATARV